MLNIPGSVRLWITAGLLLGSSVLLHAVNHGEASVPRHPLGELPYSLGTWKGEERPIDGRAIGTGENQESDDTESGENRSLAHQRVPVGM